MTFLFVSLYQILLLSCFSCLFGNNNQVWTIILDNKLKKDEGIKVALNDLMNTGLNYGIQFAVSENQKKISKNTIIVGEPACTELTTHFLGKNQIKLQDISHPQGFQIKTFSQDKIRVILISGGSKLGDIYGLYWIWDQLRINKHIPEINILRIPRLDIRFTGGGSKEAIRNALRYGATWISAGISVNNLVPWNVEPEKSKNAQNREKLQELIDYTHSLHLKFFVYEDEFSYHPSLLEEFQAKPTPTDSNFWNAVQAKYRRLLKEMPGIDGVRIRTGESTRVSGNYRAIDVMHEGENCDWSLTKRYQTWVKKLYNVVVGEFGKILFQRTWVTSAFEQHSIADVYQKIFTADVPTANLYLSPYLSTTDRFFHQPYNPTFNLTPHNMIVLLAPLDYHAQVGVPIFPSFPGQYYQGGLQTILIKKNTNLKGIDFGAPLEESWDTRSVSAYTANRLAWNPFEKIEKIAQDFCAIHFGNKKIAAGMAEILLISPKAYKYGIYIEPVAYGDFRSLPHLRLTTFPVMGLPQLDNGKKHVEFLRKIYLRCQPWQEETLLYLDHGLEMAASMLTKFTKMEPLFSDHAYAKAIKNSIDIAYYLIKTNNLYVRTFFEYFNYRDDPLLEKRWRLMDLAKNLEISMKQFLAIPGCVYRLDGMTQLLINVNQVLENLSIAEKILTEAPDDDEIKQLILKQQQTSRKILQNYGSEVVKFLSWEGRIDGIDLLRVRKDHLDIEHLRYDPIQDMTYTFTSPLPAEPVTVIPVDIQSRSFHPFVLEQPSEKNNYTVTLYLSDFPEHGYSRWQFDLFYIKRAPDELGLQVPWNF